MALHVRRGGCTPDAKCMAVVSQGVTKQKRELVEAFMIKKKEHGEKCVSELRGNHRQRVQHVRGWFCFALLRCVRECEEGVSTSTPLRSNVYLVRDFR